MRQIDHAKVEELLLNKEEDDTADVLLKRSSDLEFERFGASD